MDPQWQALGFAAFVPVSEYCQMQLAAWYSRAPQALVVYRQQVDALATRLYDEAIDEGSEAKLQRVVDELLLSSVGDQALLRLGELALERGNYTLARRSWESIHPQLRVVPAAARVLQCAAGCSWWSALRGRDVESVWPELAATLAQPAGPVNWLAYPDSDIPVASVRARLVLVSLLEGLPNRARLEAELLRRLDPDASGSLGWTERLAGGVGDRDDPRRGDVARSAAARCLVDFRRLSGPQRCRRARSRRGPAPDLANSLAASGGRAGSIGPRSGARGGVGRRTACLPRGRGERRGLHLPAGCDPCLAAERWPACLAVACRERGPVGCDL